MSKFISSFKDTSGEYKLEMPHLNRTWIDHTKISDILLSTTSHSREIKDNKIIWHNDDCLRFPLDCRNQFEKVIKLIVFA